MKSNKSTKVGHFFEVFSFCYARCLSDVDALEGLVKYWAKQGENLPRKRADIIRNIDSFAICERDGRLVGCASLFVYDSGLAEIRSLGVRLLNICSKEPAGSISTKFSC